MKIERMQYSDSVYSRQVGRVLNKKTNKETVDAIDPEADTEKDKKRQFKQDSDEQSAVEDSEDQLDLPAKNDGQEESGHLNIIA